MDTEDTIEKLQKMAKESETSSSEYEYVEYSPPINISQNEFVKGLNGKPETSDGFYRFAQELYQVLYWVGNLSGYERIIFDFIFMTTFGWHKKWVYLETKDFVKNTPISRRCVYRNINSLVEKNIILQKNVNEKKGHFYSINKYWKEWNVDLFLVERIPEMKNDMRNYIKKDDV